MNDKDIILSAWTDPDVIAFANYVLSETVRKSKSPENEFVVTHADFENFKHMVSQQANAENPQSDGCKNTEINFVPIKPFTAKPGFHFDIPPGIYPHAILISIGENKDQILELLNQFDDTKFHIKAIKSHFKTESHGGFIVNDMRGMIYISAEAYNDEAAMHAVIAHEIFHCCECCFEEIKLPLGADSREAYAYYIGWLTNKVYEQIAIHTDHPQQEQNPENTGG